jgi:hypothetical protein
MKALRAFFARLFGKKNPQQVAWDNLDYGKPSTANDEFRKQNEV